MAVTLEMIEQYTDDGWLVGRITNTTETLKAVAVAMEPAELMQHTDALQALQDATASALQRIDKHTSRPSVQVRMAQQAAGVATAAPIG